MIHLTALLTLAPFFLLQEGSYERVGGSSWNESKCMAAMDGSLWIVDDGSLYKVDTAGKHTRLPGSYNDARCMAAMDGHLWIVDSGSLYRVKTK